MRSDGSERIFLGGMKFSDVLVELALFNALNKEEQVDIMQMLHSLKVQSTLGREKEHQKSHYTQHNGSPLLIPSQQRGFCLHVTDTVMLCLEEKKKKQPYNNVCLKKQT